MTTQRRIRTVAPWFLMAGLMGMPAPAQVLVSGDWQTLMHEDQPERAQGPDLGDYLGIPINDAARLRAESWDASRLTLQEHQCRVHIAPYIYFGPLQVRIWEEKDPETQQVIAIKNYISTYEQTRTIWMDGRPHPSEYAEHTWDGFSTGAVKRNQLTVFTTHMKYGVIQRNGVPSSPAATMTEHFIRHGDYLTLVSIVDDPVYLDEPFIRTSQWVRTSNLTIDQRFLFEVVDEISGHPPGYVPHYPLGTKQNGFSEKHGIPFEATQGGKETTYPEYELKLRKMVSEQNSSK